VNDRAECDAYTYQNPVEGSDGTINNTASHWCRLFICAGDANACPGVSQQNSVAYFLPMVSINRYDHSESVHHGHHHCHTAARSTAQCWYDTG